MNAVVLEFIFLTTVIVISSYLLSICIIGIEQNTKLSAGIVGAILLPITTSLPEMISAFFSSSISDAKYATYNMLGSNTLTQTTLVFSFIIFAHKKIYANFSKSNKETTKLLIGLSIWISLPIFFKRLHVKMLGSSIQLWVFLIAYGIYMKKTAAVASDIPNHENKIKITKIKAITGFMIFATLLVMASMRMLTTVETMAQPNTFKNFNLSDSLVGTLFLAIATTLPEVLTYFWIIRLNSPSIAINGILGSDLFNIAILAVADIFVIKDSAFNFVYNQSANSLIVRKFLFLVPAYTAMLWLVSKDRKHNKAFSIILALATMVLFAWSFKVF